WITDEVTTGVFGCSVWKTIRRLWPSFASNISFKNGDGVKTDFWNEIWIGDRDLKTLFPNLFILSLQQMATVAQVWTPQGWDLILRRALNDWEISRVVGLLQVLNPFPGVTEGPDRPIWKLHNKGSFTVKSCYSCYWNMNHNRRMKMEWPWKLI
ncbi:hypothetical protein MTR67_026001, partial [Solanum verrucosum]